MEIDAYLGIAKGKINNKTVKTFILAMFAGIFISIAAVLSVVVSKTVDNYSVAKILSAVTFPIGLIFIFSLGPKLDMYLFPIIDPSGISILS